MFEPWSLICLDCYYYGYYYYTLMLSLASCVMDIRYEMKYIHNIQLICATF
jgi:hypothetical protein